MLCLSARQKKAAAVFPRPTAGPLRPVVHSQTLRYNAKIRAGRGFTLDELKVLLPLYMFSNPFKNLHLAQDRSKTIADQFQM